VAELILVAAGLVIQATGVPDTSAPYLAMAENLHIGGRAAPQPAAHLLEE
jgi:hypothetical protein